MSIPSDLADACESHFPGDYPATLPFFVDDTGTSLVAHYLCWCGRMWRCWWDPGSAGWPARKDEAA